MQKQTCPDSRLHLAGEDFTLIRNLLYERFGIFLGEQKSALIVERLQKTICQGQFRTFREYYEYVRADQSGQALLEMADLLSTNYTYFFREEGHYKFLTDVILPDLVARAKHSGEKVLRIWSAGCSSGVEAYTTAIIVREFLGAAVHEWDVGILATDIAESALRKGEEGSFAANQLTGVPPVYRLRYFKAQADGCWEITPEVKKMVVFRKLNLTYPRYPFQGRFDLIFCRNVMIYFSQPVIRQIISQFHHFSRCGGYLFIGHAETIGRDNEFFQYIKPAIYQRRD